MNLRVIENGVAGVKAELVNAPVIIDPDGKQIAFGNGAPGGEAFALVAEAEPGNGSTLCNRNSDIA